MIVHAVRRHLLDPVRSCLVLARADRTRDLSVGDVANEQVPERVLRLVLHRRDARGSH